MSGQKLLSGHEVVTMSKEWKIRMAQHFMPFKQGYVRIMPDGWLYPGMAPTTLNRLHSFPFRPDDVWVMALPKTGTMWMQEVLWTMVHNPNLDNPRASDPLLIRSMDVSVDMLLDSVKGEEIDFDIVRNAFKQLCPGKSEADGMCIQIMEAQPGRRVMKTHFPVDLMPHNFLEKTKVVYMARNPKDSVVSNYHFNKLMKVYSYKGSLENFVRMFMKDEVVLYPFWPHVKQAWQQRNHPNLHFVLYENMKADPMAELRKLNHFLDTNLSDQQLNNVADHTSFTSMKARGNPIQGDGIWNEDSKQQTSGFYRKGFVGDWENHFSAELNQEMEEWIKSNMEDCDIPRWWQ